MSVESIYCTYFEEHDVRISGNASPLNIFIFFLFLQIVTTIKNRIEVPEQR